jgi:tetratricopeptide (TPR) repeat protein
MDSNKSTNDCLRILVVPANPLGSTALQLDREVNLIHQALSRSCRRNFEVVHRQTSSFFDLRRALLDVAPHILHFSGDGTVDQGIGFGSDESEQSLQEFDEVLANLLGLCDDHLECVVLNSCYLEAQCDLISGSVPITIGIQPGISETVKTEFIQNFYDAIGAGKIYEKSFEWGKATIEFNLQNKELIQFISLRKKGEMSASQYFNRAVEKQKNGDQEGALQDFNEAIRLQPDYVEAYNERGEIRKSLGDTKGAISDFSQAIQLKPNFAYAYNNRGVVRYYSSDKKGAIEDYNKAIELNPMYAEAYSNRGLALVDRQEAILDHSRAIQINPKYAGAVKVHTPPLLSCNKTL